MSIIGYSCTVKLDLSLLKALIKTFSLLESNKSGLSLLNISEFGEILDVFMMSREEGPSVSKFTELKISGETFHENPLDL